MFVTIVVSRVGEGLGDPLNLREEEIVTEKGN